MSHGSYTGRKKREQAARQAELKREEDARYLERFVGKPPAASDTKTAAVVRELANRLYQERIRKHTKMAERLDRRRVAAEEVHAKEFADNMVNRLEKKDEA